MSHRKRKSKTNRTVKQLQRVLLSSGGICTLYLIAYAMLYGSGDADNPTGFLQSNLNHTLHFIIGVCYVIYVAGMIRSYSMSSQYKNRFKWFWIAGGILTIVFLLLLVANYLYVGHTTPAEFPDE